MMNREQFHARPKMRRARHLHEPSSCASDPRHMLEMKMYIFLIDVYVANLLRRTIHVCEWRELQKFVLMVELENRRQAAT